MPVVGHIHHGQILEVPGETRTVLIPGSPEHQNFGDSGPRGWWILHVEEDTESLEFIAGDSPEFRTVESPQEVQDDGHYYRVKKVVNKDDLPENATFIAPSPTHIQYRDLLQGASNVQEVVEAWIQQNPPEEPEDLGDYLRTGVNLLQAQDPIRLQPFRFHSIRVQNFGCYEDTELLFTEGVRLVTGKARNYPSNGAGKTTLVGEAPYWLLTGKDTKGQATEEVIRRGTSRCEVEGWLHSNQDNTWLRILRVHTGSNHSLAVDEYTSTELPTGEPLVRWEAKGVREMTAKLLRRLGVTSQIIRNLSYFSQQNLLLFADATDGDRKDVLSDLIGLTAYEDARSAAWAARTAQEEKGQARREKQQTRMLDLTQAQEEAKHQHQLVSSWEDEQNTRLTKHREAVRELKASNKLIELEKVLARIEQRAQQLVKIREGTVEVTREGLIAQAHAEHEAKISSRLSHLYQRVVELNTQILKEFDSIEQARLFIKGMDAAKDRVTTLQADLKKAEHDTHTAQTKQQAVLASITLQQEASTRAQETYQAELALLDEGKCPTCGQPIPPEVVKTTVLPSQQQWKRARDDLAKTESELEVRNKEIESRSARRASIASELQKAFTLLNKLQDTAPQVLELEQAQAEEGSLKELLGNITGEVVQRIELVITNQKEAHRKRYQQRVERAKSYIERQRTTYTQALQHVEATLATAEANINPHQSLLDATVAREAALSQEIEDLSQDIRDHAFQVAMFRYWEQGFSKQGLQSLLLEEIAKIFNETRGLIFPVLSQGVYDVQFSTLSETRAGELRERTEFQIYEHGNLVPYTSLSGGERRRVDVGIMLTLAVAVSHWMRVPGVLGMLGLDEVLSFTDASGAEGLLEALLQVQETIPIIHVITHDTHLQSLFPSVLRIEQDSGGISRIVSP